MNNSFNNDKAEKAGFFGGGYSPSGSLNETQVRKIIKEEMDRNYMSGSPRIPRHTHNGNDSYKISRDSLIIPIPVNGTITMSQVATYKLILNGIGQSPTSVTFYGGALNTVASPKVHSMIVGNAILGSNQQFQPQTTTSVVAGPVVTTIIQGCAAMTTENAGNTILKNSQGHIVYTEYPSNTIVVAANVISFGNSEIDVQVSILASNWSISGLWIVT